MLAPRCGSVGCIRWSLALLAAELLQCAALFHAASGEHLHFTLLIDQYIILDSDANATKLGRHIEALLIDVDARLHSEYHARLEACVARHMRRIMHIHAQIVRHMMWTEFVARTGEFLVLVYLLFDQPDLLQVLAQSEARCLEQLVQRFTTRL